MACGITGDFIYQRLKSAEEEAKTELELICDRLFQESELKKTESGEVQEEVKGGANGR